MIRSKQIHLNVSEEEKTTLKTWAESQNLTITQVLRNHIAKLKVFSDAELQALKTPNFVKQDFELEPESNLSFHLVNTNKTKQLFKGKTIPFGYSDSKPTTSLAEAIRDDYDPSKPNTSLAEAITGFCRPCNTVQESLDGKCMTCGEWVVVE